MFSFPFCSSTTIENTCTSNNTQTIVPSEVTVNEKKEKDKKKKEKKDNKENRNSARASSQENPSTLGAHIATIRVLFIHMPLYFERPIKIMITT
jgi:hypothetical protein